MEYKISHDLIVAYDEMYVGITDRLPIIYFSDSSPSNSHHRAIQLFKYAIETRLRWSPTEARDFLTIDIINDLKLYPVFHYINFPNGLNPETSLFYIAWEMYPKTKNKEVSDVEIDTYHQFLDGIIKKLPKFFFAGEDGLRRAYNCLIDRINYYHPFPSDDPFIVYEYFCTQACIQFLGKSKLIKVCVLLNISPLEYFFCAQRSSQRNFLMFSYFSFLKQYNALRVSKSVNGEYVIEEEVNE